MAWTEEGRNTHNWRWWNFQPGEAQLSFLSLLRHRNLQRKQVLVSGFSWIFLFCPHWSWLWPAMPRHATPHMTGAELSLHWSNYHHHMKNCSSIGQCSPRGPQTVPCRLVSAKNAASPQTDNWILSIDGSSRNLGLEILRNLKQLGKNRFPLF